MQVATVGASISYFTNIGPSRPIANHGPKVPTKSKEYYRGGGESIKTPGV